MSMCVCVSHPVSKGSFKICRGAVDRYHSLPNEDSDSPVVKSRKDAFWTYLLNELLHTLSTLLV